MDNLLDGELSEYVPQPLPPNCCPDCGGEGWWAKYPNNGDPPEQMQCERCWGTGTLDPKAHGAP
jgi:DnaJ-class molecular chaperone